MTRYICFSNLHKRGTCRPASVHSLLNQLEAVPPEESGAAVNGILVVRVDLGRLLLVDGDVACFLQLRLPELQEVVALHLLEAQDVRLVGQHLA